MHAKDALRSTYGISHMVLTSYLNDLDDEDLLVRPVEGCNHIAWQLGHLIASECAMLESIAPGSAIELPEGFGEKHAKENSGSDSPDDFLSKDEYLKYLEEMKNATFKAMDSLSDEDLAGPPPEFLAQICPNVAGVLVLIATHPMMHAGQLVPVRRLRGKPVVM